MIIDRESFAEIATHLETASEGLLHAAQHIATLCPTVEPGEPGSKEWLTLIESMVGVNGEITAIESVLRALLQANRAEQAARSQGHGRLAS